jgi:hypothetical protein
MTARHGGDAVDPGEGVRVGSGGALAMAGVRAHPHMPRLRNSASPARASGASGSPRAAVRKRSYWAASADGSVEHVSAVPSLTPEFFFH